MYIYIYTIHGVSGHGPKEHPFYELTVFGTLRSFSPCLPRSTVSTVPGHPVSTTANQSTEESGRGRVGHAYHGVSLKTISVGHATGDPRMATESFFCIGWQAFPTRHVNLESKAMAETLRRLSAREEARSG